MLKRLLWVVVATVFFTFQLSWGSAFALELDESVRTVTGNETGQQVILSIKEVEKGKRVFVDTCSQCHNMGRTKTNPNVDLSLETLQGAEPPRDNIAAMVDYMNHPTTYDGEIDLTEIHPNTERTDLFPEMRNLTQEELNDVAGYILIQPKIFGKAWGGGKVFN